MTIASPFTSIELASTLRASIHGDVVTPDEPSFAAAIFGRIGRGSPPELVIIAADAEDVAAVLRLAARTGHHVVLDGLRRASGGARTILVVTRLLAQVVVDPATGTATIGVGATWRQVIDVTSRCGLAPLSATPGRTPADDGDRLTALTHHLGLSADHVRGFELVGLLGDPVAIDALRDPGLFGELRGANGSGVITALTIDLFPAGPLYAGGLLFSSAVGPEMLQRWRQWSAALPDTCSTSASWLRLPDRPQVPTTLRGQTVLHIRFAHVGDPVDGARLVAPMRPGALLDSIGEQPWSVVVGAEPGHRYAPLPALDQNFPPTRSVGNRLVAGCVV